MSGDIVTAGSLGHILAKYGIDYNTIAKEEREKLLAQQGITRAKAAIQIARDEARPVTPPRIQREWLGYPPGVAGEAARWLEGGNAVVNPQASIVSVLGFAAGLCGRSVYNGTAKHDGINLYLCLLAPSAGGKEWMWGGCSRLFREGGMADIESDVFGPRPASGQVLAEMLSRSPSTIAPLGEMGKWLQRVLGRNANGAEIALQEEILTLYAKSAPLATWRGSATKGNRPPLVSHPSLTIMGESTLTSIWGALSDETVSSGLVSRFVFVEASAGEDRYESSTGPIPVSVLESLQDMRDLWTTDDVERFPIRWSDEAKAEDKSRFDEWSDSKQGAENHVREVISRMRQNAPRIAGVLALWDNPRAPVVTAAHVAYGWDMATASCQRLLEAYRSGEVISSSTDNCSILASYCIERVGIGGIIERRTMQSGLKRRLVVPAGYTYSRTLSSAISDAVDSGLIQLVPEEQRPNGALGRAYLVVQPALE